MKYSNSRSQGKFLRLLDCLLKKIIAYHSYLHLRVSNLKIHISNFRAIEDAQIALNGITVLTGLNAQARVLSVE